VLLGADLHAGNVLPFSENRGLLSIRNHFVGDPAYDATQHLFNCDARLCADADGIIRRMADLLHVDYERVRLWTFARAAAEPRYDWNDGRLALAKALTLPM
jgi:streptomycin 6-kinase